MPRKRPRRPGTANRLDRSHQVSRLRGGALVPGHFGTFANWYTLVVSNARQASRILQEVHSVRMIVGASLRAPQSTTIPCESHGIPRRDSPLKISQFTAHRQPQLGCGISQSFNIRFASARLVTDPGSNNVSAACGGDSHHYSQRSAIAERRRTPTAAFASFMPSARRAASAMPFAGAV